MPRGRPTKTLKSIQINVSLPEDLAAKVKLHLFSEVEGKVPHGAMQEFFSKLVREFFEGVRAT
jgi:hypothetical protein